MKRALATAFLLACATVAPAAANSTGLSAPHATTKKKPMKMKARKPMRMDEPMPTPMAREGMTKGELKEEAAKKDAEMREMMQHEEQQMK